MSCDHCPECNYDLYTTDSYGIIADDKYERELGKFCFDCAQRYWRCRYCKSFYASGTHDEHLELDCDDHTILDAIINAL
jgi:uncharacterized protein with PIN domain